MFLDRWRSCRSSVSPAPIPERLLDRAAGDRLNMVRRLAGGKGAGRSEERRVGKEGVRRVDLGGRRIIKKKKNNNFATLLIMSSRHTSMHDSCTFTVHEVLITTVYLLDIYAVSVYIFCY